MIPERLVEQKNLRTGQQRARNLESATLAARKVFPTGPDDGVIAVGHRSDEIMRTRKLCGTDYVFPRSVFIRICDIVGNRPHEYVGILRNHRNGSSQILKSEIPHIMSVDPHCAFIGIVKPRDKVYER